MLSRWFKRSNRLEHPDRQKRLHAVQALDAEQAKQAEATLLKITRSDEDEEVRQAALQKILNPDALAQLLDEDTFTDAVAQQIATRIQDGAHPICHDHSRVVEARISIAQASDLDGLLPLLNSAEQCAQLALRLRDDARQRVLDHQLLNDEAGLVVLQRSARGRDKSCHRYAKERLETIKAARASCAQANTRLQEIHTSISKALSNEPTDPQALLAHRQRLAKLGDMRSQAVAQLQQDMGTLAASGATATEFSIDPDPLEGIDLTPPEPGENPFEQLAEGFEALHEEMRQGVEFEAVAAQRDELTAQWLAHANRFPPSASQHALFERVSRQYHAYKEACQQVQNLAGWDDQLPAVLQAGETYSEAHAGELRTRNNWLKRWGKRVEQLRWPEDHTPPQIIADTNAALARIEAELTTLTALQKSGNQDLLAAVQSAGKALDEGQVATAKQHLRTARQYQKAGLKDQDRALAALSARVSEFSDWQQFATDPKRQNLLNEVEALATSPLEPQNQAARLRDLREQWRALGKPASAAEFTMQERFNVLADTAFEPCRTYYAEQAEIRDANLAKRVALCDQLEQYLSGTDWAVADMQAAETILRSARDEWQEYHPCERRALKPVLTRFESLQEQLHSKVKAAWDANVARKKAIVDEAQALLEGDLSQAVDGAKLLQRRWREVGSTPRGQDQRLWREFRKACDDIFSQRDADQAAHKASQDARYQSLTDAITALEQAAGPQSSVTDASPKAYDELNGAIRSLADGLTLNGELRKRIRHAQDEYQQLLARKRDEQAHAELLQWQEWDSQVSAAEQTGSSTVMEPPHAVFSTRLSGKGESITADALLRLVLEAEIAADLPSPSEEQSARMAFQVELMNAGRRDLRAEDYRELLQRWCSAGPKDATADSLRVRFFEALSKRL